MIDSESKESDRKFLAVDVVILPPEPISNLAINLSNQIKDSEFYLNGENFLPHITLVMGFVEDLEKVKEQISRIARVTKLFEVKIGRMEGQFLLVEKDGQIDSLHRNLLEGISFIQPENTEGAFFNREGEETNQLTLDWILDFRQQHSFGNYDPHITLGSRTIGDTVVDLPYKFTCGEIVLCHLGNYNTCRQVLGRWKLTG